MPMSEAPPSVRTLQRAQTRIPLEIDRAGASAGKRQIKCSFASGAIIDDPWNGPVQLSMDAAAVDLEYARAHGLPVLTMHERSLPVGRVQDITLDAGRLTGVIQFSASPEGAALYQDCVDGIITDTSVGASIIAVREEPSHLVAIRWRPQEVSLVDRGADPTVGINRAAAVPAAPVEVLDTMSQPTVPAADPAGAAGTNPATPTVSGGAPALDLPRQQAIMDLGRWAMARLPGSDIERVAEDYCQCGQTFEAFRGEVWKRIGEAKKAEPAIGAPPSELGLSRKEEQSFSIVRAALAHLTNDWKRAGFELECSRAIADRLNRQAQGFFIPTEVQAQIGRAAFDLARTSQSAGDPQYGGFIVPTDYRADLWIEALRAQSVALSMGVRTLPGLVGNVAIPRQTGSATFTWIPEGGSATDSNLTFGQANLTPRTIAGAVPMTRRLLQQSSPGVEALVRSDLVRGASLAVDLAVFEGPGSAGQPLGIVNSAAINTVSVTTDGTPTWDEVVQFETEVATDNALAGSLAYLSTPAVYGKMKITAKATGQMGFVMDADGTVNGYRAFRSTQLTTNQLIFGDWSQIIVAFWGVLDIKPDEATLASSGGLVLRAFQDADVAIRHPTAFAKGT